MALADKKLTAVLYSLEGVGLIFVVIFLAAYLGGLPTTNVLQNQPTFNWSLKVFGIILLILVLAATVLAAKYRKNRPRFL